MSTQGQDMEYRVEVLYARNKDLWVGLNGTSYGDKATAIEKMNEVRATYASNGVPLRVAERPLGEWTASKTPLEEAIERATAMLDPNTARWMAKTEDKVLSVEIKVDDLRLILDKLKETK